MSNIKNIKVMCSSMITGGAILLTGCGNQMPQKPKEPTRIMQEQGFETTKEYVVTTTTKDTTQPQATQPTTNVVTTLENTTTTNVVTTPENTTTNIVTTTENITTTNVVITTENVTTQPNKQENNNYNINYTNRWRYSDDYEYYLVKEEDTIPSLCSKFSMYETDFIAHNPFIEPDNINLDNVAQVRYPVKREYYRVLNESLDYISIQTGISNEKLIKLNNIDENIDTTKPIQRKEILTHTYIGNQTAYETVLGTANNVHGNRILGKVVYGKGYSGAAQNVLVLTSDPFVYGRNHVYYYQFDGSNEIIEQQKICTNAKDITCEQSGIFKIILRNSNDIQKYIDSIAEYGPVDEKQFSSSNYDEENYEIDENGNPYITFYGLKKGKQLVK